MNEISHNLPPWQIWTDTGGTFTDCLAVDPGGEMHRAKVLSSSALRGIVDEQLGEQRLRIRENWRAPANFIRDFRFELLGAHETTSSEPPTASVIVENYDPAVSEVELSASIVARPGSGFQVISPEEAPVLAARLVTGTPAGERLPATEMRLATTRGTNALLERRGARTVLFITHGFGDLLRIGNQQRPDLFALQVQKSHPLFETVVEVPERLSADGGVLRPIDMEAIAEEVTRLRSIGFETAAIAFMHSYRNPDHEHQLEEILRGAGFRYISCSSTLSPTIKLLTRAETAVVDAYLTPIIASYVEGVKAGLADARTSTEQKGSSEESEQGGRIHIMTSAGGLVGASQFRACDSLLSGPAGGVVGAVHVASLCGHSEVIAFDMGGTSTDVARYEGRFDYVFEHQIGDAHLNAPALSIESVAAGGGSICSFDGHSLQVGPQSAGAQPGPACYGAGGPLTLTDVHLLLGRLDEGRFGIPVFSHQAAAQIKSIQQKLQEFSGENMEGETVLDGFLAIANERMADAIRHISVRQGYDPADYSLVAFGGAGGQHACGVAARLGIRTILAPADAGLLSALGLGHAVIERFAAKQILELLPQNEDEIQDWLQPVEKEAVEAVASEGISPDSITVRRRVFNLRLLGQESVLSIDFDGQAPLRDLFRERYQATFGSLPEGKPVEVESLRVVAASVERSRQMDGAAVGTLDAPGSEAAGLSYFNGRWLDTPRFDRNALASGTCVLGPAIIFDPYSAVVVEPGWQARMDPGGTLIIQDNPTTVGEPHSHQEPALSTPIEMVMDDSAALSSNDPASRSPEALQLELFTNRFVSIAGEMGEMLRRTALSTNIKERLDFSCALLDANGELVVNAPHIPVHLGAMGLCVRRVAETLSLNPGDVVITNHPAYGGSHLPDITVITPVYDLADKSGEMDELGNGALDRTSPILLGYAANRAHHSEIGGSRPGSMPPAATSLLEEGVVIPPTYLVRGGEPRWDAIRAVLEAGPFPSRAVEDNLADLRASVAANERGAASLLRLAEEHGAAAVHHYMEALKSRAERQIRKALRSLDDGIYSALECLDDGSPLQVKITVEGDTATVDFEGSAPVHPGNLNATPAIVRSVVIYVLRLLVAEPLPLNEGLLRAIQLHIPPGMLNPPFPEDSERAPAVVGGNVETSQRLVDTLLKALGLAACSQGTMNNVLFGNAQFGYYETVCGGCGAGPHWDGASAVHSHMTNTRITDPEILEHRYPVRVEQFAVRTGSGGKGHYRGGDGVVREITFLEPMSLSVLTQHRQEGPYGMQGGAPGKPGAQRILRASGEIVELKSIDGCEVELGDRLILETPGGGGWGKQWTIDNG